MKRIIIVVLCLILTQSLFSQESNEWRGPNRDGFYPDKNLLTEWPEEGLEMVWKYEELGLGYTSASVTSEKVYITGSIDSISYIYAFSHSGEIIWKKELGKAWTINYPGTRSTPVINNGKGYVLSGHGKLVCFNTGNGDFFWTKNYYDDFAAKEIMFGLVENLLIDGDKLFCTPGGKDANVIALNKNTGEVIWKNKGAGEESAYGSPRIIKIKDKKFLLTHTAKSLLSIDVESGELIWSHDLNYPDGIHSNVPLYKNGYIFAMNGWGYGSVMLKVLDDGSKVEEVWRSNLFDLEHGDVILFGDNIYGTDYTTKHFSCVDWKTGQVKDSIKQYAPGSVISADGLIYNYTYAGDLVLIKPEPDGFEIISTFKVPGKKRDHIAFPIIYNGKIYVRYEKSLWVYNISKNK